MRRLSAGIVVRGSASTQPSTASRCAAVSFGFAPEPGLRPASASSPSATPRLTQARSVSAVTPTVAATADARDALFAR